MKKLLLFALAALAGSAVILPEEAEELDDINDRPIPYGVFQPRNAPVPQPARMKSLEKELEALDEEIITSPAVH